MCKFSIVIPALNEEHYLPRLLDSLANQSYRDFDVVVVDGASTDRTVPLARAFADKVPGLQVRVSTKASAPYQRNLGARVSDGEWLVFVDADSMLLPYTLERLASFIAERQPQLFSVWFRPDSEAPGDALFMLLTNIYLEAGIMLHRPVAAGMLMAVQREAFERAGGFEVTLRFGEDYDLTRRIVAQGATMQILRETLAVMSLRRVRREGKARFLLVYLKAALRVLVDRRKPGRVNSYVMGGQLYEVRQR